jgi:hypothetical protein
MDTRNIEQLLEKIVDRLDTLISKVDKIEWEVTFGRLSGVADYLMTIQSRLSSIDSSIQDVRTAINSLELNN